ncbi:vegetative cell wall protein gp1-like [Lotus japonicus]|uniref:vegetative cell wall protein gp1-like n=1 Tax=Lotus japonicus TaxID=34305 RepID=UPI00258AF132|nr:vegetative cell wall protein gp1-like [Lotus japonicus]
MSWFLVILLLSLTCSEASSHDSKKLLPSAVVVGTVYCDTCSQQAFSMGSHFISGASVAVECKVGNSKPRFKKEVKTNEHGEFKVQLPFHVRKHVRRIKGCTFKLLSSSEPHCAVASAASSSSSLSLKSRKQGEHIFSAGFFSFKPVKKPNLCSQKQSSSGKIVPDPEDFFFFPPIPFFPPPLIPNPFQPPLVPNPFQPPPLIPNPFQPPPLIPNPFQPSPPPLLPNPFQPPSPPPLFPNPFQPPSPPPLIPNPFQPPPSPPPFIPNPFQPPPSKQPPSPLFPFPPIVIPGLTPPPPPPPPPPFFPPFPPLFPPLFPPPGRPPISTKNSSP